MSVTTKTQIPCRSRHERTSPHDEPAGIETSTGASTTPSTTDTVSALPGVDGRVGVLVDEGDLQCHGLARRPLAMEATTDSAVGSPASSATDGPRADAIGNARAPMVDSDQDRQRTCGVDAARGTLGCRPTYRRRRRERLARFHPTMADDHPAPRICSGRPTPSSCSRGPPCRSLVSDSSSTNACSTTSGSEQRAPTKFGSRGTFLESECGVPDPRVPRLRQLDPDAAQLIDRLVADLVVNVQVPQAPTTPRSGRWRRRPTRQCPGDIREGRRRVSLTQRHDGDVAQ